MRIVYSSFYGRYSDSPRAIHEALVPHLAARGIDATHTWLQDADHVEWFPAGVASVPFGGDEARAELEAADVVISNHYLEQPWTKRADAFYLQTWHGTPLKRIHADASPPFDWEAIDTDVARWDALLSANAYSTALLPGAFPRFGGEPTETGSPRNDRLLAGDADIRRAAVRSRLGIDAATTAVLYTPTWRDGVFDAEGRRTARPDVDLAALAADLGPGFVVLARLHYLVAAQVGDISAPGVLDVSRHPDVAELYLAADAMVTDYSSTMFDFAVTGKPLAFLAHDLEHYRDELRGFYFDLFGQAPGPVVRTQAELVPALRAAVAGDDTHAAAYARFRERFCSLEDGKATWRVLERWFSHDALPPRLERDERLEPVSSHHVPAAVTVGHVRLTALDVGSRRVIEVDGQHDPGRADEVLVQGPPSR